MLFSELGNFRHTGTGLNIAIAAIALGNGNQLGLVVHVDVEALEERGTEGDEVFKGWPPLNK